MSLLEAPLKLLDQPIALLLETFNDGQLFSEYLVVLVKLVVRLLFLSDARGERLVLFLEIGDFSLLSLLLTAIFVSQILNYSVQLHVLSLKHIVVVFQLLIFFLEPAFLLLCFLVVPVELFVVLHKQTVFMAVASLHLTNCLLMPLFPASHEPFDLAQVGCTTSSHWQTRKCASWGDKACLTRVASVADLLNLS